MKRTHTLPRQRPGSWFKSLFGFEEGYSYDDLKAKLSVRGTSLHSAVNNTSYQIGSFDTPSLKELRTRAITELKASDGTLAGEMTMGHAYGDVSVSIGNHPNAVFQAASQFNCLEFVSPRVTPEDGVRGYSSDKTQGPACSIACGAGTVYRNYFAKVPVRDTDGTVVMEQEGQTAEHQVDNLWDVCAMLGNKPRGRYYNVEGGYTMAENEGLVKLCKKLERIDMEELKDRLRVGVHSDVEVTSTHWGTNLMEEPHTVTQVFCSACSISYSGNPSYLWEPFARLVLEGCYEATLWAAVLHALKHKEDPGARTVFLTAVGGGVFGNALSWVADAIRLACERVEAHGVGLDIRIVSYMPPAEPALRTLVDQHPERVRLVEDPEGAQAEGAEGARADGLNTTVVE